MKVILSINMNKVLSLCEHRGEYIKCVEDK